jgi:hypothetical protein
MSLRMRRVKATFTNTPAGIDDPYELELDALEGCEPPIVVGAFLRATGMPLSGVEDVDVLIELAEPTA